MSIIQSLKHAILLANINSMRNPNILFEEMLMNGGNRYQACLDTGTKPEFVGGNLVSFVLSANMHRRHLSPGQQAVIVASAQDWAQANIQGQNKITGNVTGDTVADRFAISGASDKTQRMADKVSRADPALAKEVRDGKITLPAAVKSLSPPKPKPEKKQKEQKEPESDDRDQKLLESAEANRVYADKGSASQCESTVSETAKNQERNHASCVQEQTALGTSETGKSID